MADAPRPIIRYAGGEICERCNAPNLIRSYDKERDTVVLQCRECQATREVLPVTENPV